MKMQGVERRSVFLIRDQGLEKFFTFPAFENCYKKYFAQNFFNFLFL